MVGGLVLAAALAGFVHGSLGNVPLDQHAPYCFGEATFHSALGRIGQGLPIYEPAEKLRSDFYLFGNHYVTWALAWLARAPDSLAVLRGIQLALTVLGTVAGVVIASGAGSWLTRSAAVLAGLAVAAPCLLQVPFGALRPEPLLFAASFVGAGLAIRSLREGLSHARAASLALAMLAMILAKQQGAVLAIALAGTLWWLLPGHRRRVVWTALAGLGAAAVAITAYDLWSGGALRFWCFEVPARQWWLWSLWRSHTWVLLTHGIGPLFIATLAGILAHRAGRLAPTEAKGAAMLLAGSALLGVPLAGKISTSAWSAYVGVFVVLYLAAAAWSLRGLESHDGWVALLPVLLLAVEVARVSEPPGPEVVAPPGVESAVRAVEAELAALPPGVTLATGDTWVPFSVVAPTVFYPESLALIQQIADPAYQERHLAPALAAIRARTADAVVLWTIPSLRDIRAPGAPWLAIAQFNRLQWVREVRALDYAVCHRHDVAFIHRQYEPLRTRALRALGLARTPRRETRHEYVFELLAAPGRANWNCD
ncbi:MAG: hypothetical protein MUF10_12380 [Thermoanaerobaculaceae bacterium]|nr:hypothetical protein [Thermoanaerobaculaceae bacterium]